MDDLAFLEFTNIFELPVWIAYLLSFFFVVTIPGNRLQREIRTKYIADDLSCKLCTKCIVSRKDIDEHILFHTQFEDVGVPPDLYLAPDGTCLLCGFKSPTLHGPLDHVKEHILRAGSSVDSPRL